MKINAWMQQKAAAAYDGLKVWILPPENQRDRNKQQKYQLFEGTELIAINCGHNLTNGALLTCKKLSETSAEVTDDETGEVHILTIPQVCKHLRLRHAVTIAVIQGRTLQGRIKIWDSQSKYFTPATLYVAVSRATSGDLVEIA